MVIQSRRNPKVRTKKCFPPVFFLSRSMGAPRFYHEPLSPGRIQLSATEGHHFIHVLRGKEGQSIELFDGRGHCAEGVVCQIKKSDVFAEIKTVKEFFERKSNRIIIATAAAKGQRFDWTLSKCTELGVDHIVLIQYEHSVRLGKESAIDRYQQLTVAACKQCGRNILPLITGPQKPEETIIELKRQYPQSAILYGCPESDCKAVKSLVSNSQDVIAFVGPEGGLTEGEMQLLKKNNAFGVCIGSHILRTETAAIVFAAILEYLRINKS